LDANDGQAGSHHRLPWFSKEKEIIEPSTLSEHLEIDTAIICPITEFYRRLIDQLGLSDADDAPSFNGSHEGKIDEQRAVYLGGVGAPSAGMLLETLIASGIRKTLMLGYAGSISTKCRIGDLVIPTWGIPEDGTSHHYLEPGARPEASNELVQKLIEALNGLKHIRGGVWTTDAPYRETVGKVRDYAGMGAVAVEMECTALMSVARYRKADFAALLVITDEIFEGQWKQGFDSPSVEESVKAVCESIGRRF
jgi:uridine phosphorylase